MIEGKIKVHAQICRKHMCKGNLQKGHRYNAMGMAASQARFLGLTARKNNVEFEGQQINQQRTALANQSANYYNDMLGMAVPVPPSVDNYTKTVYSFNDGALTNEITALIAQSDGVYKLSYIQQWEDDFAPVSAATSVIMRNGSYYMVGNQTLRTLGTIPTGTDGLYNGPTDSYLSTLTKQQIIDLKAQEADYLAILNKEYGTPSDGWFVRYIENTADGTFKPYFYKQDNVKANGDGHGTATYVDGVSASSIDCYTIGSKTRTEEVKGKYSRVEKDATGRYINITTFENEANAKANKDGITYSLTTSTITDQGAYEDAMNQYEFDKAKYDQSIQEINAKIEIIQAEDKNLELRLKQLDTEQDAISTEMDAVQKVIEKNTESSFKTFG